MSMLILHLIRKKQTKTLFFPTSCPKKSIKCINVGSLAQS